MLKFSTAALFLTFVLTNACKPTSQNDSDTTNRRVATGTNWKSDTGKVNFFRGKWFKVNKDLQFKKYDKNPAAFPAPTEADYAMGREETNFTKNCHLGPYYSDLLVKDGSIFSIADESTRLESPPSGNDYVVYAADLFYASGTDTGKKSDLELHCYFNNLKGKVGGSIKQLVEDNLKPYFVN
jgi:hypothetical protein